MSSEETGFRVVYSGQVKEKLKAILRKAKKAGKLNHFAEAMLKMDQRLHRDPKGLGELIGTLRWKKFPLHVGFVRPLKVDFAIDQEHHIVFVRKIEEVTNLDI